MVELVRTPAVGWPAEWWRRISSCRGYSVSSYGRVRNDKSGMVLRGYYDSNGYLKCEVRSEGHKARFKIHRVVYLAFNGCVGRGLVIDHIDGFKSSNGFWNLEAVTPAINVQRAIAMDLHKGGFCVGHTYSRAASPLTLCDVRLIRNLVANDFSVASVARLFNVNRTTVYSIVARRSYKGVE